MKTPNQNTIGMIVAVLWIILIVVGIILVVVGRGGP